MSFEDKQKEKAANIEATVNSQSRIDSDLLEIEQSEKPSPPGLIEAGSNFDRVNIQNRIASRLESARKWIVVQGKDQDESKRLEQTGGIWKGNVFESNRVANDIQPWSSTMFSVFSPTDPPSRASMDLLLDAFDNGDIDGHEVTKNFVSQYGVSRYETLLRLLAEKSTERRKRIEQAKMPKPKAAPILPAEEALTRFYRAIGFSDFLLSCSHYLSSKSSPQIERIIVERAPTAYCLICARETPREFILKQLRERLKE